MRVSGEAPVATSRRLAGQIASVMPLSARNQLDATISAIKHGSVMSVVTVRLSGGEEIVAAITRDSAEALSLGDGDRVTAIIKATEVMLSKD
jgi:molybdate transport system regulatory protein